MNDPQFRVDSFVFDSPMETGLSKQVPVLKMTAKRYRPVATESDGLTLILAHGIGAHKEQWEPAIERISLLQQSGPKPCRIREVWSFDWQNHGDAAVVNRSGLRYRPQGVSIDEWAAAIGSFVKSSHVEGHRIVALGHSAGATAMLLSTRYFPDHRPPYISLILIEPTIATPELYAQTYEERDAFKDMMVNVTSARRDLWPSKSEAFEWLSKKSPWKAWDRRVLKIYTEHGLRKLSTLDNSDTPMVVLKCPRSQEAVSYADRDGYIDATEQFARVCRALPIHVLLGSKEGSVPKIIQDSLKNPSEGRTAASSLYIPDVAHFIVQEKPDELAQAVCNILNKPAPCPPLSRL